MTQKLSRIPCGNGAVITFVFAVCELYRMLILRKSLPFVPCFGGTILNSKVISVTV